MDRPTLREQLIDWTDWDGAAFCLAKSMGLMSPKVRFSTDAKHLFWSANPVGHALHNMLGELVVAGVLENRDEPDDQYRWNPAFVGSWEIPWKPTAGDGEA
jgi:hypothetical protein